MILVCGSRPDTDSDPALSRLFMTSNATGFVKDKLQLETHQLTRAFAVHTQYVMHMCHTARGIANGDVGTAR